MDYIRAFEVELDRTVYNAGDMLTGHVYIEVEENMRLQNIKVFLRGKAHAEWKITRAGERRTMKQEEHYLDERMMIWGKDDSDSHQGIPILSRGRHRYPFHFQLPETVLPCSFESKIGNIRYYVRVNLNIPYASCPQYIRYFTIIGPRIDCMDERFLTPVISEAKKNSCRMCCGKGPMLLRTTLERTSYVCGEQILLKAEVQNGGNAEAWVLCKLIQYVEFFINKGVLGLSKEVRHTVMEVESEKVAPDETASLDELMAKLVIPIVPPTMVEICGLVQIFYTLKVYLQTSKGKGDVAELNIPITIATVPYRLPNSPMPDVHYEVAASNVEGGMYISPEFQLGQVYMGDEVDPETDQTILYQPVYVCVSGESLAPLKTDAHLLQVPTRLMTRGHDIIQGGKERLNAQETSSHAQHQMKQYQASMDEGGSFSGVKAKKNIVEDKFLKEITAKIANRNIQDRLGEDGLKHGSEDDEPHKQDIDAHIEMMRKQKKSNDNVHKALVNELRKHLSEGDESVEIEKVPKGLKKSGGSKKVPEIGSDVVKHSYLSREVQENVSVALLNDSSVHHPESPRRSNTVPTVQTFTKIYPKTALPSETTDVVEATPTEQTALLSDCSYFNGNTTHVKETAERGVDFQATLQESYMSDFPTPPDEETEDQLEDTEDELCVSSLVEADISHQVSEHRHSPEVNVVLSRYSPADRMLTPHSPTERMLSTIMPAALAATVTAAAPAAAELSPAKKMPSVAPKPRHKDRHSFPAAHQSIELSEDSMDSQVNVVIRPKSEMVENVKTSLCEDSTA